MNTADIITENYLQHMFSNSVSYKSFIFKDETIFASLTSDIPMAVFINFSKYFFMNHRTGFKYHLGANAL
jgi:hypothetical protein